MKNIRDVLETDCLPAGVRAVCFDAVDTLIFPKPRAHAVYAAAGFKHGSRYGQKEIQSRFRQAFQEEEQIDRESNWKTCEEREHRRWKHIVTKVLDDVADPDACFCELFAHFASPDAWSCAPELSDVFQQLEGQGFELAIASNFDTRLRTIMAGKSSLRNLKHVIISSEVGWQKPSPQFFASVCELLHLQPSQIMHIGDNRQNDYEGAKAAGLRGRLLDGKQF